MTNKLLIPFLAVATVLLVLCCTVFGLHNVKAEPQEAVTATESAATLKTVFFDVPGMTCATCPYTVKKTLQKIDGVTEAESSFETMSATATFDPSKTSIDEMLEALKNQGYPSTVKEN